MKIASRTFLARPGQVERKWFVVDATDQVLGRLAVRIATVLMGKHKPEYTPHVDTGDFVVVLNAHKVKLTGWRKPQEMIYESYSGFPGGRKVVNAATMRERHPERIVQEAVQRMLPKNALARHMLTKLKTYNGDEHPHQAQQPEPLPL